MNQFRFKICLVILLAAVVYAACKKMDQPADLKKPLTNEERFFSAHASNDPTVQAAAGFMKKLNDKYQFTEKAIAQIGFPRWDKAMVLQDNKPSATGRALSGNDSTVVIIPFVRETQSVVNAALRVCMREADTSYRYLCDWQYEDSLQTGRSPKEAALLLMMMDKEVFGNRVFSITDRSLFGDKGAAVKITSINSTPSFTNLMSAFTVCYSVYEDMYEGQVHGCEPGDDNCTEYREVRFCIDITPDIGTDPGGDTNPPAGDPGGGSGGGGGNGGPPPPPCETTAIKASLQNNCGPGWVPIDDPGSVLPNQSIIDSLQGFPCVQGILAQMPGCNALTENILTRVFSVNSKVNVIFKPDSTLPPNVNGETKFDKTTFQSNGTINFVVHLNTLLLRNGAKELIAKTLIHESVHAFINYYWTQYVNNIIDSNEFKIMFPVVWKYKSEVNAQHEQMTNTYLSTIMSFVHGYNPTLTETVVKALAWNGLTWTRSWRNLGADTTTLLDIYQVAKYGTPQAMATLNMSKCN